MKNDDVELIQRSLTGDENAFAQLVKKYQKQVHALVWRKVGPVGWVEPSNLRTLLLLYKRYFTKQYCLSIPTAKPNTHALRKNSVGFLSGFRTFKASLDPEVDAYSRFFRRYPFNPTYSSSVFL